MLTINELRNFGANVDEGLARMMNNEGFYLRMVGMGIDDKNFQRLKTAVEDLMGAFPTVMSPEPVRGITTYALFQHTEIDIS